MFDNVFNIVGKTLAQLRQDSSMSVQELSEKSGVSVQKIEDLEAGRGVASFMTMMRLSRVLSSGVGAMPFDGSIKDSLRDSLKGGGMFSSSAAVDEVVVRRAGDASHLVEPMDASRSDLAGLSSDRIEHNLEYLVGQRKLVAGVDKRLEPMILTLAAGGADGSSASDVSGAGYDMSMHVGDGEIFLYVLQGAIQIHYPGGVVYELGVGDSVCYGASSAHHLMNAGGEVARVLMVTPEY